MTSYPDEIVHDGTIVLADTINPLTSPLGAVPPKIAIVPKYRKNNCRILAKRELRYNLSASDMDWRGEGKTHHDALNKAFELTGHKRSEFEVTKWGKNAYGKSFPTEYRHKNGAEVNIDFPHKFDGPDAPHVGWQSPGKRSEGGATRGHIILDNVPFGRY